MNKKGSSLLETRRRNRVLIKDTIFRMEPIRRNDIAEELGLTLPTITTFVNEMIGEGILEERPLPEEKQINAMGRKPAAIAFQADAVCAIGVELGPYNTRIVEINLNGDILASSETEAAAEDYQTMTQKLARQVQEVIQQTGHKNLIGVGIGLPGFIDCDNGIIRSGQRQDWIGRHLAADLENLLGLPVMINNNVRLRAVGYEMGFRGKQPGTFAYFFISKGIACPLMVKDDILTGYTAGAGEIGQTVICVQEQGSVQGRRLDDLAGEKTVLKRCREAINKGGARKLRDIMNITGRLGIEQVIEAQLQQDEDVCRILNEAINYLGIALANMVNLINPGFVVVDGYIMQNTANQRLLKKSAVENFYGLNEEEVTLVFKSFNPYFGAEGAAYFIIRQLFLQK